MPNYTGAVARDNWEKHGERPSIQDWGAKGDGATDDTAAIQAAFNEAARLGKSLYIPAGVYRHTGLVLQPQGSDTYISVNLFGESNYGLTKLVHTGTGDALRIINNRFFQLSNFLCDTTGGSTNGIVITSSTSGNGSQQGVLTNVGAGNFTTGAGIQFGESASDHAASEMTAIGCYVYSCKYGINMEAVDTAAIYFYGLRAWSHQIGLRYLGDASYGGFPIGVFGASMSANDVDFAIVNPCNFTVRGHISEGVYGSAKGRLIEAGTAGVTPALNFVISLEGVTATHDYAMDSFTSAVFHAPADVSIRNSVIGNGYVKLSGANSTRRSKLIVENSALWYGSSAPTPGYYNGGDAPIVYDPSSVSMWRVELRGVANDNGQGITVLDDTTTIYNCGTATEVYRYKWSAAIGSPDLAPAWARYRVHSIDADLVDGSPWYGLGYSTVAASGGYLTQLAGYYGLRLRSANGDLWLGSTGAAGTAKNFGAGLGVADIASLVARIQTKGAGSTNATSNLFLANAAGAGLLEVKDNGEIYLNGTNCQIRSGSGSPEGVVAASPGSLYLRDGGGAGTVLYLKESGVGNTGWVAYATAALPNVGTAGTYTKVTTDAQGRVSSGTTLADADIPTNSRPIATQSVVTGSRSLGTVYQNNTGKPMFVSVIVVVPSGNSVVGYTDSTTPPTTGVAQYGNSTGSSASFSTAFWVLPGNYYKVAGGASTLSTWMEWY